MPMIFKICPAPLWEQAKRLGRFHGSSDDIRDGFIHFSTAAQAAETAAKHFAGQDDLLLVSVDVDRLGAALKWEPSRGGALFPHLYGDLDLSAAMKVEPLPLGPDAAICFRICRDKAFSSEVDTSSRKENASNQKLASVQTCPAQKLRNQARRDSLSPVAGRNHGF